MTDLVISEAGAGEGLGRATVLVAIEDLYLAEYSLEPGTEPGQPHYYDHHTDSFYVLEGELEFRMGERVVRATAGMSLVAPRGAVHAFPVAIGGPARFLNLHTPGGFERYMRELVAMQGRAETPDAEFLRSHDIFNV
jgi:mannose-6-phosphate isomerase-like protein (cupin superfamily)